jgi:hypothetical protein
MAVVAVALGVTGALGAAAVVLFPKDRGEPPAEGRTLAEPITGPTREASDEGSPAPRPPAPPEPRAAPPRQELEAPSEEARKTAPAEWPPARAFTARCRAPGGGCLPECTELAGGKCLDPCFIHTTECSKDCLRSDGTCGFPPPDTE